MTVQGRVAQHVVGHQSEDSPLDPTVPAGADDDRSSVELLGEVADGRGGITQNTGVEVRETTRTAPGR